MLLEMSWIGTDITPVPRLRKSANQFQLSSAPHLQLAGAVKLNLRPKIIPQHERSDFKLRNLVVVVIQLVRIPLPIRHGRQDPPRSLRAPQLTLLQHRRRTRKVRPPGASQNPRNWIKAKRNANGGRTGRREILGL